MSSFSRHAFIVGVNDYGDGIPSLQCPVRDAVSLAEMLQKTGVAPCNVRLLLNGSSRDIGTAFELMCSEVEADDVLLFYYSGHGYMDATGEFYMYTSNTDLRFRRSTALSGRFISDIMSDSRCRNQLMVLDCCHSGAFARSLSGRHIEGGRVVITASSPIGNSYGVLEDSGLYLSAFTRLFVEGLRAGQIEKDNNGRVSVLEIYSYVHERLIDGVVDQVPYLWIFGLEGDLFIA